jgi:hypothetical protein
MVCVPSHNFTKPGPAICRSWVASRRWRDPADALQLTRMGAISSEPISARRDPPGTSDTRGPEQTVADAVNVHDRPQALSSGTAPRGKTNSDDLQTYVYDGY